MTPWIVVAVGWMVEKEKTEAPGLAGCQSVADTTSETQAEVLLGWK